MADSETMAAGDASPAGQRVVAPRLVGRTDELESLLSVLSEAPAVAVVEGEAGVGKTRLVTELATRPELAGRRFLTGACRRIREPFPLGPLVEALRGCDKELERVTVSPVAGALRPLLPELSAVLPPQPPPLHDRASERYRMFRGLAEVLGALGRVALVLEDLHWADEQTLEFIGYLLAEPPPGLSVVLTFRGQEVDPGLRASLARLPAAVGRADVMLAALDERQTGALAAAILGTEEVSEEFAAHLCERASGLPLAVEELLALLQARGALVRRGGLWARRALSQLEVPAGIRDSVLERVSRLSADAQAAAAAAAVLQVPVPASLLADVARLVEERATAAVEELLASGIFSDRGESVSFRHVLEEQAVFEATAGPRRRALHGRAASALGAVDPPPLGQLAHHLRRAGRLEEWAVAAESAADQAVELGRDDEAARLLAELLREAPPKNGRPVRLALKLSRAAIDAIETLHAPQEVIGLLSEVLEQDPPRAVRGELRLRLAMLLGREGGDFALERRLYAAAADDLEGQPELKVWSMLGLGIPAAPGVPLSEHRLWLQRALDLLPEVSDPVFEVFALGKVAMVLVGVGDPAWRDVLARMEERTRGSARQPAEVRAYSSAGEAACSAGHHQTARRLLTEALAGASNDDNQRLQLRVRSALALLDYCSGCWDRLGDEVEVLHDELSDYPRIRIDVDVVAACLALAGGKTDDARRRLAGVVRQLEEMGGLDLLAVPVSASVRLALAAGEVETASAAARRLVAALESSGMWAPITRALPTLVQALVASGELADARMLVARCTRELRGLDAPLAPAALRHARGFVDAGAGRSARAAASFLAAADLYEPPLCPYEAAQAREQAALSLVATGSRRAEQTLRDALTTYDRLGASWDVARARAIARRHDVSVPARHRGGRTGYGTALSPRERAVAELAATGRTNKEIANELYISHKTVDKHLRSALRKLDLRSRASLAGHFPATAARRSKNGELAQ